VIVWLHPGAFVNASAGFAPQNGEALAASTGAVIVAPNYRLGPFGFLAHTALASEERGVAGNYGLSINGQRFSGSVTTSPRLAAIRTT
jgi:para-nitrobenzyl esterase